MTVLIAESTTKRSTKFLSWRTLPGHGCGLE